MINSQDPRHLKRRKIVQELFEWNTQSKITNIQSRVEFYDDKTKKIIKAVEKIDNIIEGDAQKWSKDKINLVDLAILRQAVFEIVYEKTEPDKVIIDEAVELAKEFGGDSSPNFINGVLATVKLKND